MIKIAIYEPVKTGTSIDVLEQKKLGEGKIPVGIAFLHFEEAADGDIYYKADCVVYFDTVRITVIDKFHRWNYCVYRIDRSGNIIYDPFASVRGTLEKGKIVEIRLSVKEGETFLFYEGEGYQGKLTR